jgi:hypothetical protein
MTSRALALLLSVPLCALAPRLVSADTSAGIGVAEALFQQAREEMRRGDYDAARPKLSESERIDPSTGTLLNLVLCEERLGFVASAWMHARELSDRLPASDDRKAVAERELAALTKRVPRLTVRLSVNAPPDTRVMLDDVALGPSSLGLPLPIDPGVHRLVAEATGRTTQASALAIEEAQGYEWVADPAAEPGDAQRKADAPLTATQVAAGREEPSAGRRVPRLERSGGPRWVGWTAAGVGLAALTAGSVMALMTLDRQRTVSENCPNKVCGSAADLDVAADGRRLFIGTLAAFGAGAAGLGVGVYVLSRGDTAGRSAFSRSGDAMPLGAIVSVGGRL